MTMDFGRGHYWPLVFRELATRSAASGWGLLVFVVCAVGNVCDGSSRTVTRRDAVVLLELRVCKSRRLLRKQGAAVFLSLTTTYFHLFALVRTDQINVSG